MYNVEIKSVIKLKKIYFKENTEQCLPGNVGYFFIVHLLPFVWDRVCCNTHVLNKFVSAVLSGIWKDMHQLLTPWLFLYTKSLFYRNALYSINFCFGLHSTLTNSVLIHNAWYESSELKYFSKTFGCQQYTKSSVIHRN